MVFLQGFLYQFSNHEFLNIKMLFFETKLSNWQIVENTSMVYYDALYDLVEKKTPRSSSFPIPMLRNGFYGQLGRGGGGWHPGHVEQWRHKKISYN